MPRSIALLKALDFSGISEIEYKRDVRTGEYRLIEMNPRHWDQHRLGAVSGVNLTEAVYLDLVQGEYEEARQEETAVRWIAEVEYFPVILRNLIKKEYHTAKLLSYLKGKKTFSVFAVGDIKPSIRVISQVLCALAKMSYLKVRSYFRGSRDMMPGEVRQSQ